MPVESKREKGWKEAVKSQVVETEMYVKGWSHLRAATDEPVELLELLANGSESALVEGTGISGIVAGLDVLEGLGGEEVEGSEGEVVAVDDELLDEAAEAGKGHEVGVLLGSLAGDGESRSAGGDEDEAGGEDGELHFECVGERKGVGVVWFGWVLGLVCWRRDSKCLFL